MPKKLVTVTKRTPNANDKIQSALATGRRVMAKAGNWFEVVSFREEMVDPQHPEYGIVWWATGHKRSHLSGGGVTCLQVKTVNWFEPAPDPMYDAGIYSSEDMRKHNRAE